MGLDIGRIEAWTRQMLEAEARRRGIRGPEFRPRRDLIRLILKHQYGDRLSAGRERIAKGVRTIEQARGTMAGLMSSALSALPEPRGALTRLRARLPLSGSRAAHDPREPVERPPAAQRAAAARAQAGAPGRRTPTVEPPPSPVSPEPQPVAAPRRAASSVSPSTRTFVEEPIRTHSMARLLAVQGHRERALAIYAELLAQNSEDEALRREAQAVREGRRVEPQLLPDPPAGFDRVVLPEVSDVLRCEGTPATGLRLHWQISEDGQRRARAVLGRGGELAVRVVAIRPDPVQVVCSEVTEHGPVAADGGWQSPALPDAARCFAAVGLRDGDHFVAIVHAHPSAAAQGQGASAPALTV